MSRRAVLGHTATAAALTAMPLSAEAAPASARFGKLLDTFANEMLQLSPETATGLGVDHGANAGLKFKLDGKNSAARAAWTTQAQSMRRRLAMINRAQLTSAEQTRYDIVTYAIARGLNGTRFFYAGADSGFDGRAHPYVVNHQECTTFNVPEFLNSQHQVKTAEDADAYLSRISEMARQINEETDRVRADAARGVVPPDFIAANALGQLRNFRAQAPDQQPLVQSLAAKAKAAGLTGDWAARTSQMVKDKVYPALDAQIAAFETATRHAPHTAGVQRLPMGADYYVWALGLGTTTTQTPMEVHKIGLEQNAALLAKMDTLLKAQGLTTGSVGARVQALNSDPRFLYPDTDAGRADLIAYLNDRVAALRPLLRQISDMPLKADLVVKRVPPDIQDGAALGYMNFASLDGSRPATYYVNLKSTALWPKYQLPTLTAHEGIPGHTWQGAYLAEHHSEIPLITSLMQFNAFIEGWALYAEQLAEEHGLYADDPFGRIGYLQAQQFRACRLVVDTGIHAMGWSREKAIAFLVEQTGRGKGAMTSEVDRYCAWPGQACGYKTGHNEILRLRAKAQRLMGPKFSLAAFDDAVVQTGGAPLTVLAQVIDRYITKGA